MEKKLILRIPVEQGKPNEEKSEIVGTTNSDNRQERRSDLLKTAKDNGDNLKFVVTSGDDLIGRTDNGDIYETLNFEDLDNSGFPIW
jgi:hypothetical protein